MLNKICFSSGQFCGAFYDKGHVGEDVVEVFTVCEIVIVFSHAFTVVGCEYDEGIVVQSKLLQGVEEAFEMFIGVSNLRVILRNVMVKISVVAELLVFWNPATSTGYVVEFEQSRLEGGTFEKFAEIFRWGVWSVWVLVVNPHEEIVFAGFFQEFYGPVGCVLCVSLQ